MPWANTRCWCCAPRTIAKAASSRSTAWCTDTRTRAHGPVVVADAGRRPAVRRRYDHAGLKFTLGQYQLRKTGKLIPCIYYNEVRTHVSLGKDARCKHHARPSAVQIARAEPGREHLQFTRGNWLSNRVFRSYEDILDHCCYARTKLIDMTCYESAFTQVRRDLGSKMVHPALDGLVVTRPVPSSA
jgi:hypothetical protein